MLLKFIEQIGNDFGKYDPFDCWPLIIDEFADFVQNELKSN